MSSTSEKNALERVINKKGGLMKQSVLDFHVIFRVRDWVDILASVSDTQLFLLGFLSRAIISVSLLIAYYVVPSLVFGSKKENWMYRDNSFTLWGDQRMAPFRMWDAVHFFHIAEMGYDKENMLAFFPGFPTVVKMVSFVVTKMFPFLHTMAPVVFYVTLLNLIVSGLTLVLLRRLTVVTYLGAHAVKSYSKGGAKVTEITYWSMQTGSFLDAPLLEMNPDTPESLQKEVWYRKYKDPNIDAVVVDDESDALSSPTAPTADRHSSSTSAYKRHMQRSLARRSNIDKIIGGACFMWIISPTAIYTAVAYTEACYGFLTMLALYLLSSPVDAVEELDAHDNPDDYRRAIALTEARLLASSQMYPTVKEAFAGMSNPITVGESKEKTTGARIVFHQRLTSFYELVALVLLFLAGTIRSNALLYTGFFWYPVFMQIFFHSVYLRRALQWYAPQWMKIFSKGSDKSTIHVTGVHSIGRWPHPLRIPILFLYSAIVLSPSLFMNYRGWSRYFPMWGRQDITLYGTSMLNFYSFVQNRFWNVGFLSSFLWTNLPHILHPLPLFMSVMAGVRLVMCADLRLPKVSAEEEDVETEEERALRQRSALTTLWLHIERFVCSSTVTILLVHLFVGLGFMNIHVTSRFIMGIPSVYWMVGQLLVRKPEYWISRWIPFFFINYTIMGITLFANSYDWT